MSHPDTVPPVSGSAAPSETEDLLSTSSEAGGGGQSIEEQLAASHKRISELEQQVQSAASAEETARFLRSELAHVRRELDWARNEMDRLRKESDRRKISLREAEHTLQFRWTLPAFLFKRRKVAQVESGFEFQLEQPKSLNLAEDSTTLIGWCFTKSGEFIQGIRAVIGDTKYEGAYGRKRFDVRAVFPAYPNSDRCGFEIEVKKLPSRFSLTLEALDDRNQWHSLQTYQGRVAARTQRAEPTPDSASGRVAKVGEIMQVTSSEKRMFQKEIHAMTHKPLVSVIMPVFNTPAEYLRLAIRSVLAQLYPNWQLCIADDASTSQSTRELLAEAEKWDERIVVIRCSENRGISAASNAALRAATGDIITLMDHDDLISPVALLRLAQTSFATGADLLYSDEGHIDLAGEFLGGIYRPAFSLSYLRSHPYIVHLVAFSARLLNEIGGFDEKLQISQDYDLILRAAEKARIVVHIPEILYLWRQIPGSAGHLKQEEVTEVSTNILVEHLKRTGVEGTVGAGFAFNYFSIRPKVDLENSSVAVIIPTKNQAHLLAQTVASLEKTWPEKLPRKIVIVDHQSDEPDAQELLKSLAEKHLVLPYSGPFNYSAINNFGVRRGAGDAQYLLLCNNDIEAKEPQWLERMLEAAADETVGAVAPMLLYPDEATIQHAGVSVGLCGTAEHLGKFLPSADEKGNPAPGYLGMLRVTREVSAITTACALFRRQAFEAVGGFSEEMQVGYNDTDLCLRLWQIGYRTLYCGETSVLHHESATRGKSFSHDPHPADSSRFLSNWGWLISQGDPFYNPNLKKDNTAWKSSHIAKRQAKPASRRYAGPSSLFTK